MQEVFTPLLSALATAVGGTIAAWFFARAHSGRSARTLEQATKVIEFVGRYCECYERLEKVTEAGRTEADRLLLEIMRGVREDISAERALLPEFERSSSSLRHVLLLYSPNRPFMWLLHVVFYVLVLFVPYVLIIRVAQGHWEWADMLAVLVSSLCAMLVRLVIRLISPISVGTS